MSGLVNLGALAARSIPLPANDPFTSTQVATAACAQRGLLAQASQVGAAAHLQQALRSEQELFPDYPQFDAKFLPSQSKWSFDNCLTYALNATCSYPQSLYELPNAKNPLELTATELNRYFSDPDLVVLPPSDEVSPQQKRGYYPIFLFISKQTGYNEDETMFQEGDFHFVVQNSDGTFSHRRGSNHAPTQLDSENRVITDPRQARFYYVQSYQTWKHKPICVDYQYVGHLYVKTYPNRIPNTQFYRDSRPPRK